MATHGHQAQQHGGRKGHTDAIEMVLEDHRKVEELFREFEKNESNNESNKHVLKMIMQELLAHTFVERALLYPEMRSMKVIDESLSEHAEEEHTEVEEMLYKLGQLEDGGRHKGGEKKGERAGEGDGQDEQQLSTLAQKLFAAVRKHVEEEEKEMLPKARSKIPKERLEMMPEAIMQLKKTAPKDPVPPKKLLELVEKAKKEVAKSMGGAGGAGGAKAGKEEEEGMQQQQGGDAAEEGVKTRHQAKTRGGARQAGKLAEPEQ